MAGPDRQLSSRPETILMTSTILSPAHHEELTAAAHDAVHEAAAQGVAQLAATANISSHTKDEIKAILDQLLAVAAAAIKAGAIAAASKVPFFGAMLAGIVGGLVDQGIAAAKAAILKWLG
jgi:hypothetical protein